jgi:hypothetical protein
VWRKAPFSVQKLPTVVKVDGNGVSYSSAFGPGGSGG